MNLLGSFNLIADKAVCDIVWLSTQSDWGFVRDWEVSADATDLQSVRDSLEYAQTGAKRWGWLANQGFCVASKKELLERIEQASDAELGFALAVKFRSGNQNARVIAFCYVRRLWLNHLYVEFLAVSGTEGVRGVGSLLLYVVADLAIAIGAKMVWGECTAGSQSFYRKLKARFLMTSLQVALESKDPSYIAEGQLPGAVADRFEFGETELRTMANLLKALWRY